mmetsp:Transcript_4917/g.11184  ORF Transcript_4917/g.11184 Transcript_4917/m.11184 type:complete len:354 (-) Transcript_4917:512-1573(-)
MATQTSRRSWSGDEIPSNMRWKTVSEKVMAVSLRTPACVRCVMDTRSRSSSRMSESLGSIPICTSLPCSCVCSARNATSMREKVICCDSSACAMLSTGPCGDFASGTTGVGAPACILAAVADAMRARAKASYTCSWCGDSPPTRGLRASGSSLGYLPVPRDAWSTKSCPASLAERRAWKAPARASSISLSAFSTQVFSTSKAPRSTLSLAHTCTIWSTAAGSEIAWASRVRRWLPIATLRGSLQVATASEAARDPAIRCAPLRRFCSLGSVAKSFSSRCLVVVAAMATLRSTAEPSTSRTPRSTATATNRRCAGFVAKYCTEGLITTEAGREASRACSCASPAMPPCCGEERG